MTLNIPDHLSEKAKTFPESSYGANRVTFVLSDNRTIQNVILAWGSEIVKVGNKNITNEEDMQFDLIEIADVVSEI